MGGITRLLKANALLFSGLHVLLAQASPSVNVALRAAFNAPPYLVELLETAADEAPASYFPLLDRIADGHFDGVATDQELYTKFLKLLQDDELIKDPDSLSSFQFALSIHSAAPAIEAHYQYYNTSVEPSIEAEEGKACEAWVDFGGKQYCSPELEQGQGRLKSSRADILPFDRVLENVDNDSNGLPSILYADITSPSFKKFHRTISHTAKDGKTSYRLRHKPGKGHKQEPLMVHGYGVSLDLKRTDYIVIDDRQDGDDVKEAESTRPDKPSGGEATLQDEEVADLKPLSASELSSLALKASDFVLSSEQPFDTLLKLTQDFPKHSSSISAHNVSAEFLAEHKANREILLPPGFNTMWINGRQMDYRRLDPFSLLEYLRRERSLIDGFTTQGFTRPEAIDVLRHPAITESQADDAPARYDWRDETEGGNVIIWMNDITKDKRYNDWPDKQQALLQRTFPGQLPSVRKDIHNMIIPVDFTNPPDLELVVETMQGFVKRKVPIRIGLVPTTSTTAAAEQARVVYHLLDAYGLVTALAYLESSSKTEAAVDEAKFEAAIKDRKLRADKIASPLQEVLKKDDHEAQLQGAANYLKRLGIDSPNSPIFVNGAVVPRNDEWIQMMSNRVTLDLRVLQRAVFENQFEEEDWIPSWFLENALHRRNALVLPEDEKDIHLTNLARVDAEFNAALEELPAIPLDTSTDKQDWAQLIIAGDFATERVAGLVREAISFRQDNPNIEIRFIHTGKASAEDMDGAPMAGFSTQIYQLNKRSTSDVPTTLDDLLSISSEDPQDQEAATTFWTSAVPFAEDLGFQPGKPMLMLNGRVIGPIPSTMSFVKDDFATLLMYESAKRNGPAMQAVAELGLLEKAPTAVAVAKLTSLVALSTISDVPEGIFESAPTIRTSAFEKWNSTHTMIELGNKDKAAIQILTSLDPATESAQQWSPLLKTLSELSGVHVRIFLNPRERLEDLPVKRFYRYVLDSKPTFDESGSVRGLRAEISGVPAEALLTMAMHVPPSWLVGAEESVHDLDNLKLSSLKGESSIDALYELESILIEGHSRDMSGGYPPRGAQLVLGTAKDPRVADTIVMANIGYFQFKANPGYYNIGLRPGRSQDIFQLDSAGTGGWAPQPGDEHTDIALTSFQGVTLYPRLSRKPGMETEDVLEAPKSAASHIAEKATEIADSILSKVGLKDVKTGNYISKGVGLASGLFPTTGVTADRSSTAHAGINIFSVASGHLYERMLNIMMVSVMKHTKHTVKFWFIEQFLSPSFKSFLPTLAAEYGFQYEMVTYKWPHWLRQQKEKQRVIWGYKILFLDVLFPLDLDKVIFVDADQIVRTDMYELVTHDLKGAPYGFTPMCDSRTEMEGFRFWKQGYWKNFLRGLPYHISALYVVDLKRFRQLAAGDRLRQQYHQLSADPNSLSNLDQDLPNNMQVGAIPIHSLPQEWLWCETWCSDESFKDAKTVDLCNNPLTKEPKLDRARRQVPEWTEYDEEIAKVARRAKEGERKAAEMLGAGEGSVAGDAGTAATARPEGGKKHDEL